MLKYLLLLILFLESLSADKFYRTANTVTDKVNFLMWQDNDAAATVMLTHKEALEYCENLVLESYDNWRLPTIKELELIVDKKNDPFYIAKIFKNKKASGYWAKDTVTRTLNFYAWYMNFISGTPYYYNRDYNKYVRCVRDIR